MSENLKAILECVPFLLLVNGKFTVNTGRLLETILIAVLGGFLSAYITVKNLEVRINQLEAKVDKIYTDIYKPSLYSK